MDWVKVLRECAEEVMQNLGTAYLERVYEEAIVHEFRLRGIPYERQRNVEIVYKGYSIGIRRPDCILNPLWSGNKGEEFLVEMKAQADIKKTHIMQAQVYLTSMNINKGVVLNFNKKTEGIDIHEIEKYKKELRKDIATPSRKKSKMDIEQILMKSGKEVMKYLGTEFFYYGPDIYIAAVGVELRLKRFDFHNAQYPILYKGHEVANYSYNYVFSEEEAAKIFVYKNESILETQVEELKEHNKIFNIKTGFVLALPEIEEMKVVVRKVE